MTYLSRHPAYDVAVEGAFVGRGQWIVHGTVTYRPGALVSSRDDVESEARLELMLGIARESRRGHDAGARSVHVVIDGDHELSGLFRIQEYGLVPPRRADSTRRVTPSPRKPRGNPNSSGLRAIPVGKSIATVRARADPGVP